MACHGLRRLYAWVRWVHGMSRGLLAGCRARSYQERGVFASKGFNVFMYARLLRLACVRIYVCMWKETDDKLLRNVFYWLFKCFLFAASYISLSRHSFSTSMTVAKLLTNSRILFTLSSIRPKKCICINSNVSSYSIICDKIRWNFNQTECVIPNAFIHCHIVRYHRETYLKYKILYYIY